MGDWGKHLQKELFGIVEIPTADDVGAQLSCDEIGQGQTQFMLVKS